jgi:hypothetical protein
VLEQIYKEKYNEDSEKFSQYISEICIANEVDFNEDLSYLQEEIREALKSEVLEQSHDEIWDELIKKYV